MYQTSPCHFRLFPPSPPTSIVSGWMRRGEGSCKAEQFVGGQYFHNFDEEDTTLLSGLCNSKRTTISPCFGMPPPSAISLPVMCLWSCPQHTATAAAVHAKQERHRAVLNEWRRTRRIGEMRLSRTHSQQPSEQSSHNKNSGAAGQQQQRSSSM